MVFYRLCFFWWVLFGRKEEGGRGKNVDLLNSEVVIRFFNCCVKFYLKEFNFVFVDYLVCLVKIMNWII